MFKNRKTSIRRSARNANVKGPVDPKGNFFSLISVFRKIYHCSKSGFNEFFLSFSAVRCVPVATINAQAIVLRSTAVRSRASFRWPPLADSGDGRSVGLK